VEGSDILNVLPVGGSPNHCHDRCHRHRWKRRPARARFRHVIEGSRIQAIGPRASVQVPAGAQVIDIAGKWIVPGIIDTNVHLSLYGGMKDRYESLVRYNPRQEDIVLEAAQIQLKHGVTTVRDSCGMLIPLTRVRDRIARGEKAGARIQAAGNIVGWGGPYSITFSLTPDKDLTLFQEQMNDAISQAPGKNSTT